MDALADLYVILRSETAGLVGGFTEAGLSGEQMAEKIAAVTTEVEAEIKKLDSSLISIGTAADDAAIENAVAMDKMRADTARLAASMEEAEVKAAASTNAMGAKIDEAAAKSSGGVAAGVATLGKIALGVVGAGVIVGAATVKMAADFQSATMRLVTSAGETDANIGMVRDGILNMAGEVGYSADKLAEAMYTVESGGQHGADGLLVLKAAAQGAKAENADLVKVTDAVTSILQDYHLKADQSATVTSKLVAAVGSGKSTFEDFTGALHSVLPVASASHISLNDILGDLASMTVHGMSADQAAQNLSHTIQHLQTTTQGQRDMLGELGLSAQDLSSKLGERGLSGTLQMIETSIADHMGPAGKVVVNAFNQSKDSATALQQMLQKMPASMQGLANEYLKGSISLGDYTKQTKELPSIQADLAKQFATVANRAEGFSTMLKQGQPDALAFADALKRATGDSTTLNTALMLTGENADYTNKAIANVTGAVTEADGSVKGWTEVQATFNQKIAEARDTLDALGIKIGMKLLPTVTDFLSKLDGFLSKKDTMDGFATGVSNALQIVMNAVTSVGMGFNGLQDIMEGVTHADTGRITKGFREVGDAFNNLGSNLNDASQKGAEAIETLNSKLGTVHDMTNTFENSMADTFQEQLPYEIKKGGSVTSAAAISIVDGIMRAFAGNNFTVAGQRSITSLSSGMKDAVGAALDASTAVTGSIKASFELFDPTPEGKAIADSFGDGIKTGRQAVDAATGDVLKTLNSSLVAAAGPSHDSGTAVTKSFAEGIKEPMPTVTGASTLAGAAGVGPLWGVVPSAGVAGSSLADTYGKGILNPLPTVSANAGQLANTGVGPLWGVVGSAFASGSSVGANFARGISAQILNVELAANNLAGAMSNRLPHSPAKEGPLSGKGSPDIAGANVGRMVADGLLSQRDKVATAMSSMIGGVPALSVSSVAGGRGGVATGIGGSGISAPTLINLTINVGGSVRSDQELVDVVQQGLLRLGIRNVGNGVTYGFGG